jgi:hypothetical protein
MQLLHAVKTIRLRQCIKFVRDDCMLENECSCHFKLFQKLRFHHYSRCHSETLRDQNDDLIVYDVNITKHYQSKMCLIQTMHQNIHDCLMILFADALRTICTQNISQV